MKNKKVNIPVNKEVEKFLKDYPQFQNNLLINSNEELFICFKVDEFIKMMKK